jgi:GT2 family glycosyltransferase
VSTEKDRDTLTRSFVVTTYGGESAHTQQCLGRIRQWKSPQDEVIVVVHDESPTLRQFLELCRALRIVDRLVLAEPGHGHVRGVNLGFELARAETVFNVCIDMRVGGEVVAQCEKLLLSGENVGLVGWHYDWSAKTEGSRWRDGVLTFSLRKLDDSLSGGRIIAEHENNIRAASWYTGRVFDSIGTVRFTCVNGSFFAIRRSLWQRLGGFDERLYPVHFADDFLTYAVLDQGLDVVNIPQPFRCGVAPEDFLALTDLHWQNRDDPDKGLDRVTWTCASPLPELSDRENVFPDMVARSTRKEATVSTIGQPPWAPVDAGDPRLQHYDDAAQVSESDVIACTAAADPEALAKRLRPGGLLVAFGCKNGATNGGQRLDSLAIFRNDGVRAAFKREHV